MLKCFTCGLLCWLMMGTVQIQGFQSLHLLFDPMFNGGRRLLVFLPKFNGFLVLCAQRLQIVSCIIPSYTSSLNSRLNLFNDITITCVH